MESSKHTKFGCVLLLAGLEVAAGCGGGGGGGPIVLVLLGLLIRSE